MVSFKLYKNMKITIKKKLILSFVFIITSFIVIGLLNYFRQTNYKKQLDIVSGKMYKLEKKSQKSKLLLKQILLDVLNRNSKRKKRQQNIIEKLDSMAIMFYKNIDGIIENVEHQNPMLERIRELFQQFYILSKRVSNYLDYSNASDHPDTFILYINIEKKLQSLIDDTALNYEHKFEEALQNMSDKAEKNISVSILLIMFGIFFSIFIFFKLIKTIMNPIKDLLNAINKFDKDGDGKAKVFLEDEFGEIAEAFNELSGNLKGTIKELKVEVNERKKVENDLLELKDILFNTINSMPSILIGIDGSQIITQWNNAAEVDTNINTDQALGKKLSDIIPVYNQLEMVINESIKLREVRTIQLILEGEDRKRRYMDVTVFPLTYSTELGAVIRMDDITERKNMEEVIIQSDKMKLVGEIAAGMAHDFNNVLGGIIGTLSIIQVKRKKNNLSSEKLDDYFEDMNKSADRATQIVKQLMTLSRKQELILTSLDLNKKIKNIVKICKTSFNKSIEVRTIYSKTPAIIKADATQIEQVLLNLAINSSHAMTFMRDKGEEWGGLLEIGLKSFYADESFCKKNSDARETYYWELYVQDEGVGITDSIKLKIFDPFFTTKDQEHGTGLGLSMVYNIVKQHNGFVNFNSGGEKGTKFSLFFPKLIENGENIKKSKQENYNHDYKGLALVVDDESIMRKVASAILSEIGFNVIHAADGEEGIKTYIENKESLKFIILDLMMPKKSGIEVLAEIKKYDNDIIVLIVSGTKKDDRLDDILKYKNVSFIEKPYSFEQLTNVVKTLVNK